MNDIESRMNYYWNTILVMADATYDMLALSFDALNTCNNQLASDIIDLDDQINRYEIMINELSIEHLTLRQPVAKDIRTLVGGMKIASDLERIGDYAKNVSRYLLRISCDPQVQIKTQELQKVLLRYFEMVIEILNNLDTSKAYSAIEQDDEVDVSYKLLISDVTDHIDSYQPYPVEFTSMIRNIERAGDHLTNICEQIIYIVDGKHVYLD